MIIFMIFILFTRKDLTDKQRIDDLNQKFSTFFYEFKEDGIASWLFYVLYVVRRSIIFLCYNFIEDYILQLLLSLAISLLVIFKQILFYVAIYRCYKSKLHYVYHCINESLICTVYLIILISFDKTQEKSSLVYTNLCINIITATWANNIAFSLIIIFMKIFDQIKGFIEKRVKATQVTNFTEVKVANDKEILSVK